MKLQDSSYLICRKGLQQLGGGFTVCESSGGRLLYGRGRSFSFRDELRLYYADDRKREAMALKARKIATVGSAYDVVDPEDGLLGSIVGKGLSALIQERLAILDPEGREIGTIREDSAALSLVRKLVTNLIPRRYDIEVSDMTVCRLTMRHSFPLAVLLAHGARRVEVDLSDDFAKQLDKRLGLAAGVLLFTG
jgi:hypothetical protein